MRIRPIFAWYEQPTYDPQAERAAHLFACLYGYAAREMCEKEGIADEQISRGAWIADHRRDVRYRARSVYGDPAYGSWPQRAYDWMREELHKVGVLTDSEALAASGRSGDEQRPYCVSRNRT